MKKQNQLFVAISLFVGFIVLPGIFSVNHTVNTPAIDTSLAASGSPLPVPVPPSNGPGILAASGSPLPVPVPHGTTAGVLMASGSPLPVPVPLPHGRSV